VATFLTEFALFDERKNGIFGGKIFWSLDISSLLLTVVSLVDVCLPIFTIDMALVFCVDYVFGVLDISDTEQRLRL